jgi:hypothetical protein
MILPSLFLLPWLALSAEPDTAPPARALFNGKDLDGWVVEGQREFKEGEKTVPVWVARDGLISCMTTRGGFGFLRYQKQSFADFHLHLEYRFTPPADARARRGNSGVGIRTVAFDPKRSKQTRPSFASYEIQLLDDADLKPTKHSTASLYRYVAPREQAARPAPQWNVLDVTCIGPRIDIQLNGKKVVDLDQTTIAEIKDKPRKGFICLQNHGSRIDFRNIRVREIKANGKDK